MSNEHECRSCQNTMKIYYVCESKSCMNFKHEIFDKPSDKTSDKTSEILNKEEPILLIKQLIEISEEHKKQLEKEEKLTHLRKLKNEAMKRYRNKYPEKFHKKAREMSKNQYDRRKTDPDFLKKKCESSKRSYHKRKAERQEEVNNL